MKVTPSEVEMWSVYQDDDLGYTIDTLSSWGIRSDGQTTYYDSGGREYYGISYYIYVEAIEKTAPFPELVTVTLGEELAAIFEYQPTTINSYPAYTSLHIPSMEGSYTTFVDAGDRYIAFSFTPYRDEHELAEIQAKYFAVYKKMLSTLVIE